MNWSTVWELVKINILYSNSQTVTAVKRKQEKNPKKNFSMYKSVIRQQIFLSLFFAVIYIFMYVNLDFNYYPGYFTFYTAIFFIMATLNAFTAMYSIFYESDDVKLYAHLPIKSSELYLAKVISSFGMGLTFLMPILSLFFIAYWQMAGLLVAIIATLIGFGILFLTSTVLSLYVNSFVGSLIARSHHRKLISTVLMSLSTIGAVGAILYMNVINSRNMGDVTAITDCPVIPYFRGFYDLVKAPFSLATVLNFYLPVLVLCGLVIGLVKWAMPNYYQSTLYTRPKEVKANKQPKSHSGKIPSLTNMMIRHHTSTLQNATLLSQTYLMPLIYVVIFLTPMLVNGFSLAKVSNQYFGIALLVGAILGTTCAMPTTLLGVGISLEKENYNFLRTLPLNFKGFLIQKFIVLAFLQALVPACVYLVVGLWLLHLSLPLMLAFLLGLCAMIAIQGQVMYWRDYKHLNLLWQDVTQLFNRNSGQWLAFAIMMLAYLLGGGLALGLVILGNAIHQVQLINMTVAIVLIILAIISQVLISHNFWKKISH
ncbi:MULTISPECIES: ABC transporter permease [Streptococcus]|uniref:ABC transporter permease n=1 Tax=Streptococcus vicugnae TaxID=2740579 RepID=A0A4R5G6M1_9STRE|nr:MULTISPECIES: ABC transporter permease [Streptococcus]TDE73672.1 ABC transporter permease [Streptococcus vicugnae]